MREHWVSIRVREKTGILARQLAAKNNMKIKDFIHLTLEMKNKENENKKKGFGFKL